jgi:pimeloyl-ACP methyl ester carboxylesterase
LGGALALLLARTYPQRFPVLALLAPAAALAKNLWILELLRFPGIGLGVAAALGPWILPLALRLVYHRRELITPEVMAGYAATFRPLANRLAFRRLSQQVRPWPLNLVEELMRDLHQPVCLIWGTEDRVLPVAQAHWLKARLPQAELHLLPGIGHVPQEEAPETVNKIIIAFLARSLKN